MANRCYECDDYEEFYDASDDAPCSRDESFYVLPPTRKREEQKSPPCRDLPPRKSNNTTAGYFDFERRMSSTPRSTPVRSRRKEKREAVDFSIKDDISDCRDPCSIITIEDSLDFEIVECPNTPKTPIQSRRQVEDPQFFDGSYFDRNERMEFQNINDFERSNFYKPSRYQPQSISRIPTPISSYSRRSPPQQSCQNSYCTNKSSYFDNMLSMYKNVAPRLPPSLSEIEDPFPVRKNKPAYSSPKRDLPEEKPACCRTREGSNLKPECCNPNKRFENRPTVYERPYCPSSSPSCEIVTYCIQKKQVPCFTTARSTESIASKKDERGSLESSGSKVNEETQFSVQSAVSDVSTAKMPVKKGAPGKTPSGRIKAKTPSDRIKTKTPSDKIRVKTPSDKVRKKASDEVVETPSDKVSETPSDKVRKTPSGKVRRTPSDKVRKTPSDRVRRTPSNKIRRIPLDHPKPHGHVCSATEKEIIKKLPNRIKPHKVKLKKKHSDRIKPTISFDEVPITTSSDKISEKDVEEKKIEDKKEDSIKLLSVTISTVMLLATGSPIPDSYSSWTIKYLKCIKNCKGQHPPNVKKILKMLGVREDELESKQDKSCFCGGTNKLELS